jgi:hypothetical protein
MCWRSSRRRHGVSHRVGPNRQNVHHGDGQRGGGRWKQKPEQFEGGEKDVVESSLDEQLGLKLSATQTNQEAFEINAFA